MLARTIYATIFITIFFATRTHSMEYLFPVTKSKENATNPKIPLCQRCSSVAQFHYPEDNTKTISLCHECNNTLFAAKSPQSRRKLTHQETEIMSKIGQKISLQIYSEKIATDLLLYTLIKQRSKHF